MDRIDELIDIIQQEAELTEQLETLLHSKQEAFIGWNADDLESVIQKEISYLHLLSELETKRGAIVKELLPHAVSPTMSLVTQQYPSEVLERHSNRLRTVSHSVMKKNEQNRKLLSNSLGFVQNTLSILTNNYKRQLLDQKV